MSNSDVSLSVVPVVPEGGNTILPPKKRAGACKLWCFTLNNPTDEQIEYLNGTVVRDLCEILVWQHEKGENGNPHIQGALKFKVRKRPMDACKILKGTHWERMKAKGVEAYVYASKEDSRVMAGVMHGWKPKRTIKCLSREEFYPWQKEIDDMVQTEADDRSIVWLWETAGNTGKSALTKYLCLKRKALVVPPKTADIHMAIINWEKETGDWPEIIIVDVPRESLNFINYGAIEKVKDGCFYSGKYEGGMCVMNSPHVIFMANEEPRVETMSADRWDIVSIEDGRLVRYPEI